MTAIAANSSIAPPIAPIELCSQVEMKNATIPTVISPAVIRR